jgi:hypothetical protein
VTASIAQVNKRTKTNIFIWFLLIVLSLIYWGSSQRRKSLTNIQVSGTPENGIDECPNLDVLWSHVYHPGRLDLQKRCLKVTGEIVDVKTEADGDWHIQLRLDDGQTELLNEGNFSKQHGNLVVEPICESRVKQEDAQQPCGNLHYGITRFRKGTHVVVVGSYVHDQEHGWMEIHPVSSITEQ